MFDFKTIRKLIFSHIVLQFFIMGSECAKYLECIFYFQKHGHDVPICYNYTLLLSKYICCMKYFILLSMLLLTTPMVTATSVFAVQEGQDYTWSLYQRWEQGVSEKQELFGKFQASIVSVDEAVLAHVNGTQLSGDEMDTLHGFSSLLVADKLLNISFSEIVEDLVYVQYDVFPLIWPADQNYYSDLRDNHSNSSYGETSISWTRSLTHYLVQQKIDQTPVDGDEGNVTYMIDYNTGVLLDCEIHLTNYFSINPPSYRYLHLELNGTIPTQNDLPLPIMPVFLALILVPFLTYMERKRDNRK